MTNKSEYLKMKKTYLNAKYGGSKKRNSNKRNSKIKASSNFHKHYHEHLDGSRHVHKTGHQHQKIPYEVIDKKHKYEDKHAHTHNEYDSLSTKTYSDSIDTTAPLTSTTNSTNNLDLLNNELTKKNNKIKQLKQQLITQEALTTKLDKANNIVAKQKNQLTQLETQLRDTNNTEQQITQAEHEAQIMELKKKNQSRILTLNNTLEDREKEIKDLRQKISSNENINVVKDLEKKIELAEEQKLQQEQARLVAEAQKTEQEATRLAQVNNDLNTKLEEAQEKVSVLTRAENEWFSKDADYKTQLEESRLAAQEVTRLSEVNNDLNTKLKEAQEKVSVLTRAENEWFSKDADYKKQLAEALENNNKVNELISTYLEKQLKLTNEIETLNKKLTNKDMEFANQTTQLEEAILAAQEVSRLTQVNNDLNTKLKEAQEKVTELTKGENEWFSKDADYKKQLAEALENNNKANELISTYLQKQLKLTNEIEMLNSKLENKDVECTNQTTQLKEKCDKDLLNQEEQLEKKFLDEKEEQTRIIQVDMTAIQLKLKNINENYEKLKNKYSEISELYQNLNNDNNNLKDNKNSVEQELKKINDDFSVVSNENKENKRLLDEQLLQINNLEEINLTLKNDISNQKVDIEDQMKEYKNEIDNCKTELSKKLSEIKQIRVELENLNNENDLYKQHIIGFQAGLATEIQAEAEKRAKLNATPVALNNSESPKSKTGGVFEASSESLTVPKSGEWLQGTLDDSAPNFADLPATPQSSKSLIRFKELEKVPEDINPLWLQGKDESQWNRSENNWSELDRNDTIERLSEKLELLGIEEPSSTINVDKIRPNRLSPRKNKGEGVWFGKPNKKPINRPGSTAENLKKKYEKLYDKTEYLKYKLKYLLELN